MRTLDITLPSGEKKTIKIEMFKALDGWDIQNKFIDFAASTDAAVRRQYTLEVLSYAQVMMQGQDRELPLSTDALIDNHLQTWQNVQAVFEEVLIVNGIDPKTHADKANYWTNAGAEMAVAFIAEATKLLGPSIQTYNEVVKGL
jgi:hypothetical protein